VVLKRLGYYALVDPMTGKPEPILKSEFPLSWLYELTGTSSQGKGWYQLRSSLEALWTGGYNDQITT